MNTIHSGKYTDQLGSVAINIRNDGRLLRTTIRGIEFCGDDFDALRPAENTLVDAQGLFILNHGYLCSCTIEFDIPVPVVAGPDTNEGQLHACLELGPPGDNGGLAFENLALSLRVGNSTVNRSGTSGWFEDALFEIQAALPDGTYIKACINCAFSDYSPGGHGLFGGLACFRDAKEAFLSVSTKADIFRLWEKRTEYVQETYLCPEFKRKRPRTGYRG